MASFHHEGMELDAPAGTAGRLPHDIQQDESGAPTKLDEWDDNVPTAGPKGEENPMLDESEMERFVREGMEAWDLYDKRSKEKNSMYEEGFPVPDEHLNWKMRLQYGGATVTPELMEKVRAVDFLKDPPEVDLPPKSDKGRKEAEKIMQEEHDRRWKKVAEDVDDLLECFRGFDRAKEKILKRREGILTPFPDGGDWQWECYRTRQAHEREEREREIAEAEAEGREPPPEKVPTMPDLAKAEQAFRDLQEQGVFTQKQVDEELELSERRASWDCVRVALTLEEAAKAAEKSGDYTGEKLPKKSDELKAAEKVLNETDDPPKPSFYYGGFEENDYGDEDTCARIAATTAAAAAAAESGAQGLDLIKNLLEKLDAKPEAPAPAPAKKPSRKKRGS